MSGVKRMASENNLLLVDHHCHGVVPVDLDAASFEDLISEAFAPAPEGTSHWDKPVALSIRRWCAPVLDLPKFCAPSEYIARRTELGAKEVNRRFLSGAGIGTFLVDSGNRPEELCSVADLGAIADAPAHEIVRMEAVAERVAARSVTASGYARAFEETLRAALRPQVVGLKSVLAYRATLRLDYTQPGAAEVEAAAGRWFAQIEGTGQVRITDPVLERHLIWVGAEIARERNFPMQFHIGIGDPDIELNRVDPSHLTPWIKAVEPWGFPITLLHCYPFHREAGLIAENFPCVYFDVGFVQNWVGPSYQRIMDEALELAPFTKQLYSSDAFGLSELYYLGALRFRTSLARALDRWVEDDECPAEETARIMALIGAENARRIYRV
jgi:predicted TIM-barrel fold metal-dependent hydrolase